MHAIAFSNTSENPSELPRTVSFTLVDGDGTANGGTDTVIATATVNVAAVDDLPTANDDAVIVNMAPVNGATFVIPEWALT